MKKQEIEDFDKWFNSLTLEEQQQYVDELDAEYYEDTYVEEPSFYLV